MIAENDSQPNLYLRQIYQNSVDELIKKIETIIFIKPSEVVHYLQICEKNSPESNNIETEKIEEFRDAIFKKFKDWILRYLPDNLQYQSHDSLFEAFDELSIESRKTN